MGKFSTGQAIRRREDMRFVTGKGRYTDDIVLPGQTWLHFFRSPYAHGDMLSLDLDAARETAGVLAVYTADDLQLAGVGEVPGARLPGDNQQAALQQPALARDRVRYVGEPVVAIVAASPAAARDAADTIDIDVDERPAVVTPRDALAEDASLVHDTVAGNFFGTLGYGDHNATDAVFARAARTVSIDIVNNRVAPTAMEPRACNASYAGDSGELTLYQGCQGVHPLRDRLSRCMNLDPDKVRVVSPDVGGGFGLKFFLQPETVVAAFASMQLGRPVKWAADRAESFLSDVHGRDHVSHAELALDDHGRFLAMRARVDANIGAWCSQAGPFIPWFGACMTTGSYAIPVAAVDVRLVVTNTVPVDAYRGAGRPEATYLIERLVDRAARETGIAPDELRRRNFITAEQFPYQTPTGRIYDSGDYHRIMARALQRADWDDFATRRSESTQRGLLRGIGLASYVEICSAAGNEESHLSFGDDGRVTALVGTQSTGQGHETSYAQLVAERLGIDMQLIDIVQGDSYRVPTGQGTNGSRSMAIGGSALCAAADKLLLAGRLVAAQLLQADADDIEFDNGSYRVAGSERHLAIVDVACASFDAAKRPDGVQAGLASSANFAPEGGTFPNGCHVCEVEIDPQSGAVEILRYTVVDDVGVVINPMILEGQIVGGVAQGLGQALSEQALYDRDDGQLLTATFMDYAMPRSNWMPPVDFSYCEIPSPRNPLGVKGAGEAGTVGSAPALVNAVLDALAARGVEHLDMPLTPAVIWQALNSAA